tara:strand:- start:1690 stop:2358 length:669 start_codon:yes stop_codon:yes gene_type:complete
MSRLFLTPREIDFINDVNKEIIKDVVGQRIYYYSIRTDITKIHDVYEEAPDKVFNPPIEIEARVEYQPEGISTGRFGTEGTYDINVYLHNRDLLDRNIDVRIGDYFSYDATFFEIATVQVESTVYGQIEHAMGVQLLGKQARMGLIDRDPNGPTDESYTDPGAVQETFVQQRGFKENRLGETADKRALQENGTLDKPISGPAEVSPRADENEGIKSSFYDES